jgi:competence protein ComEC
MKKALPWIGSVLCGLIVFICLFSLPSSWGGLLFIIPALVFNPKFREFLQSKNINFGKAIKISAIIIPFVTTIISASTSSTSQADVPMVSASSAITSSVSAQSSSSALASSTSTSSISSTSSTSSQKYGAKLKVHYIDVGQGDSEFIELPNGQCMLIDAGVPDQGSTVVNYIKKLGHNKIDYLIATHPHNDHIGGMTDVINNFSIGNFYMPHTSSSDTPTTKVYEKLLSALSSKNISVHTAKAGVSIIKYGNLSANLIAPCGTNYGDLNQYSAVMMLQYGNNKFLFMGDAGNVSEDQITADIKADVLKVGHHGSKTATSQSFLNKVKPKYAVIEVGSGNSYGHPTAQTLNRLQAIETTIYRTDECGTIIFTSDGNVITINKSASSIKENAPNKSNQSVKSNSKSTNNNNNTTTIGGARASTGANQGQTVYITDTGKCYHTSGCSSLKKSKHAISLKDAKSRGYKPCKKCHPPE